jgi:hypothetical protein
MTDDENKFWVKTSHWAITIIVVLAGAMIVIGILYF